MGLREEGLRAFGSWEPLAHHLRRATDWCAKEDAYAWEHSEEFIKGLKDRGFNLFITHFSKGYGIRAEANERENTRRIVDLCHKHGIYAGGYLRFSSFIPETLRQEVPDCAERFGGQNSLGKTTRYNIQYWRYFACPTSLEWREYIERLVEIGINDIGLDCLHVDGVSLHGEPFACHCERCVEAFRQWLNSRYPTPEEQEERFAFTGLSHVDPPDYMTTHFLTRPLPVLSEPVAEEWMWFRCQLLVDGWKALVAASRRCNPEVVVQGNTAFTPASNNAWDSGVRLGDLAQAGSDGFFTEEPTSPDLTADGRLHGYFETFKKLRRLGVQTFTYNREPRPSYAAITDPERLKRAMAHQMAFNLDSAGIIFGESPAKEWPFVVPEYMAFHRDRRDLFHGATTAHDVALYYSEPTYALNSGTPVGTQIVARQVMLRGHVPFGYVLESHRSELREFRAVVMPETECVTESEANDIADYVKQGGGLLIIGANTGCYDANRRLHRKPPLMEALGLEWGASSGSFTAHVGQGRAAFLPQLDVPQGTVAALTQETIDKTKPAFDKIFPEAWQPALNGADMLRLLHWAAGGFRYELTVPDTVVAEFVRHESPARELIHLVNFDIERDVGAFEITCPGRKIAAAKAFTPDNPAPQVELLSGKGEDSATVRVSGLKRYLIVGLT